MFLGLQMQIAVIFVHYPSADTSPMPVPSCLVNAGCLAAFPVRHRNGSLPQAPNIGLSICAITCTRRCSGGSFWLACRAFSADCPGNGARVGLRHTRKLPRQLPSFHSQERSAARLHGRNIRPDASTAALATGWGGAAEFAFVLVQIAFRLLQLPGLGRSGNHAGAAGSHTADDVCYPDRSVTPCTGGIPLASS